MLVSYHLHQSIWNSGLPICFAACSEGQNHDGFAPKVSDRFWYTLRRLGSAPIGSLVSNSIDGQKFYGIVCYSAAEKRWYYEAIRDCFDKINDHERSSPVSSVVLCKGIRGAVRHRVLQSIDDSLACVRLYEKF